MKRLTHEEFIERLSIVNPDIIALDKYVTMHTKIECECKNGHKWFAQPQDLLRGTGCLQCSIPKRAAKRTKTHEKFVEEVHNINPDITVLGRYVNTKTKIEFRCPNGHIWITTPANVLTGKSCLECANIQSSLRQRKDHKQFIEEVHDLQPDITVLGTYINARTKIEFMCPKGHIWKTAPYNILDGCSCPMCKGEKITLKKTKTHEQFIKDLSQTDLDVTILGRYERATKKINCKCNKCEWEWMPTPNSLLSGIGCPKCCESKGEKAIEKYLKENEVAYESQKRFADCIDKKPLPFDFYLPNYNLCIEYQGAQHYMVTRRMGDEERLAYRQKHDRIKREYCETKGINLLEIPYTNLNQVSEILADVIKTGKSDLINTKLGGVNAWQSQNA